MQNRAMDHFLDMICYNMEHSVSSTMRVILFLFFLPLLNKQKMRIKYFLGVEPY